MPKRIRDALGMSSGGRIEWVLGSEGQLAVLVKHRYEGRRIIDAGDSLSSGAPSVRVGETDADRQAYRS